MTVLENEIWITLTNNVIKYYEELGYVIPKVENKRGRIIVKNGTKILVKVDHLPKASNVIITRICNKCGDKRELKYVNVLRHRKNGEDLCVRCGTLKIKKYIRENVPYEKTLKYYCETNHKEYLLEEFSYKNSKKPTEIFASNKEKYWWICPNCKNEYYESTNNRTNGTNCPYCNGTKVLIGFNDLWTTHSNVAKYLNDTNRGYEITFGSHNKEIFKCLECHNTEYKYVYNIVTRGFNCSRCSDNISYSEKFIMSVLSQINNDFEYQKVFNWSLGKKYDFYLPIQNSIIESHGKQHYQYTGFNRTLKEEQENDKLKKEIAYKNKIKNYIIIDCRSSDMEYIKNNILKSKLNLLFNISDVDWIKCHEFACNSLIKLSCDLWNEGRDPREIGIITNLHSSTIVRYLKQGVKLGWCNYDPKKSFESSRIKIGKKLSIKIIQLSLGGEFIKEWESMRKASRELDIEFACIVRTCKREYKSAGGYKWMYKEDYDEFNKQKNDFI